jgi:hypothetical protein
MLEAKVLLQFQVLWADLMAAEMPVLPAEVLWAPAAEEEQI